MKKNNLLLVITALSSNLMFVACSEQKIESSSHSQTQTSEAQGNWKAKSTELSQANADDIKTDLAQLNQITQNANTEAIRLRNEVKATASNPKQLKEVLKKSQDIQSATREKIMALNLKSVEVQNVRTQIIDSIMLSQKLYMLSLEPNFNLTEPSEAFKQLSQRSIRIQQKITLDLDHLNQQYPHSH